MKLIKVYILVIGEQLFRVSTSNSDAAGEENIFCQGVGSGDLDRVLEN